MSKWRMGIIWGIAVWGMAAAGGAILSLAPLSLIAIGGQWSVLSIWPYWMAAGAVVGIASWGAVIYGERHDSS